MAENARYFAYYVRILALKIVDNLIWYGTLCTSDKYFLFKWSTNSRYKEGRPHFGKPLKGVLRKMKGGIGILPGVDTGFKCGGARFILEQKHPDLGTNFFTIYIFPVLHKVFLSL